jgi:hypothetical protein
MISLALIGVIISAGARTRVGTWAEHVTVHKMEVF